MTPPYRLSGHESGLGTDPEEVHVVMWRRDTKLSQGQGSVLVLNSEEWGLEKTQRVQESVTQILTGDSSRYLHAKSETPLFSKSGLTLT